MATQLLAAARAAAQAGDQRRAAAMAQRAWALSPTAPEPLFFACCCLLKVGDKTAFSLLAAMERFADYASGWEAVGTTLLGAGHADAALVAFRRAAAHTTRIVSVLLGQAAAEAALNRHADAAATCKAATQLAPQRPELALRCGQYLREAGDLASARVEFERAVVLDPLFAEAWFSLGLLRQDLSDPTGAADAYAAALSRKPDWHEAAFNLGVARQDAGDLERALDAYARAFRLRPGALARIAQALISGRTGRLWLDIASLREVLTVRT